MAGQGATVARAVPRVRLSALACVALGATAIIAGGCGGSSEAQGSGTPQYRALLRKLDRAAKEGRTIKANKKANDLKPIEKEMVKSFCNLNWQMKVNREAWKLDQHRYVVERIRAFAAYDPSERFAPATNTALRELREIIDLNALDGKLVRRYSRACYR
jgi:hypothetical protein